MIVSDKYNLIHLVMLGKNIVIFENGTVQYLVIIFLFYEILKPF